MSLMLVLAVVAVAAWLAVVATRERARKIGARSSVEGFARALDALAPTPSRRRR